MNLIPGSPNLQIDKWSTPTSSLQAHLTHYLFKEKPRYHCGITRKGKTSHYRLMELSALSLTIFTRIYVKREVLIVRFHEILKCS